MTDPDALSVPPASSAPCRNMLRLQVGIYNTLNPASSAAKDVMPRKRESTRCLAETPKVRATSV